MTAEHKILTLVDRGVTRLNDLFSIVGTDAAGSVGDLLALGAIVGAVPSRGHVDITERGLDRLNELDRKHKI